MAERAQIVVKGIVQGVGFRPFVYNLAAALGLKGYVTNTVQGVFIDVEGGKVFEFIRRLRAEAPPLSRITDLTITKLPVHGYDDFTIRKSMDSGERLPFTLVSPDVSICDDCLRELTDPSDRRYLYPFINCTNCGPRYSITRSTPYDRPNTTMAVFTQCPLCSREYHDPTNRRFHAQPNACASCGPRTSYKALSPEFKVKDEDNSIQAAISVLQQGGIVAIKGIGGFHIACDATNREAVTRLRERKRKSNKPFAVMCPDMQSIEKFCHVSEGERDLVSSIRRPIVLLTKNDSRALSDAVSPKNKYLGVMLPYTPLHYLLFFHPLTMPSNDHKPHFQALVMTSGNLSEEPIVRDNEEAFKKLSEKVDGFLVHDRDIFMRVDDSVVRVLTEEPGARREESSRSNIGDPGLLFIRRSRGYAPDPISLSDEGPEILGCGADLKNTFTLTKGNFAVPSQHIGDMENYETVKFYEECLENLKAVYRVKPQALVHDLHPGYLTTRWAIEQAAREPSIKLFSIQHHYAHIGSIMAEHGLATQVIGVALDGTGYGTDGNLWGGEFLIAGIEGFERPAHFKYVALPGGEAAIRNPWKTAVSFIVDAAGDEAWEHLTRAGFVKRYGREAIRQIMLIGRVPEFSPLSSGAGRLFDAVSALVGVCDCSTFEGEAAMALEALTVEGIDDEYPVGSAFENGAMVIDFAPTFFGIIGDMHRSTPLELIATRFHNTVASVIRSQVNHISESSGINNIALSGGTFQNRYLVKRVRNTLSREGYTIMMNRNVPCNDGCISLGQAYLIRERLKQQSPDRWGSENVNMHQL
jgi:hydrogenase maturation protein HypF